MAPWPPTTASRRRPWPRWSARGGLDCGWPCVTGRTFFELSRVCDRLDLFDAVVAENGGVLYFPAAGRICDMAVGPPPRSSPSSSAWGFRTRPAAW